MNTVTATKLRNNLFDYLDKVKQGRSIIVLRKKNKAARLVPVAQTDWRDGMSEHIKIVGSPNELITPIDDIWKDYI